jgi:PPOX class probable F420-dependent enzyme
MDTELSRAIDESKEVYITTFDSDGRPGTVPVWFDHHAGRFYISTYPDSLKVRKIARNPAVRLAFGRRTGPGVDGEARVVTEEPLIQTIAPVHAGRYPDGPWDSVDHLARMWTERSERCLLEIVPS